MFSYPKVQLIKEKFFGIQKMADVRAIFILSETLLISSLVSWCIIFYKSWIQFIILSLNILIQIRYHLICVLKWTLISGSVILVRKHQSSLHNAQRAMSSWTTGAIGSISKWSFSVFRNSWCSRNDSEGSKSCRLENRGWKIVISKGNSFLL